MSGKSKADILKRYLSSSTSDANGTSLHAVARVSGACNHPNHSPLHSYTQHTEVMKTKKKRKKTATSVTGGVRVVDEDEWGDRGRGGGGSGRSDDEADDGPLVVDAKGDLVSAAKPTAGKNGRATTTSSSTAGKDSSPPRRRARHGSPSPDNSPPRRKRHDSPGSDTSPPRRKRHDCPPPATKEEDASPPRRRRHDSDGDASPPRRRQRHDSPPSSGGSGGGKAADASPPRRRQRHDTPSASPPRERRKRHDSPEADTKKEKEDKEVGLKTGAEFRKELEAKKAAQAQAWAESAKDAEATGQHAETVVRDRRGRKLEMLTEFLNQESFKEGKAAKQAKEEYEWGRGKVQKEKDDEFRKELEDIKNAPFARYESDPTLERARKAEIRTDDPMAEYMLKKQRQAQAQAAARSGKPLKPEYKGPAPRPNRFNVRPGYRWDGIDRGNGFEAKWFKRQNEMVSKHERDRAWGMSEL